MRFLERLLNKNYSMAIRREDMSMYSMMMSALDQMFVNHSDEPGGSTLGNISNSHVSIKTADIGLAQLAMHSSYEVAGIEDIKALKAFAKAFYEDRI